jgi:2-polyprenyl-3-methyl-5-hydroxy-6-metoxy-1,4-benzoquinol methylase
MIAPNIINNKFLSWNKKHGAPYGNSYDFNPFKRYFKKILLHFKVHTFWGIASKFVGIFSFQINSSTRNFEYPWAYYSTKLNDTMSVLDIGGGMGGFQFVLAKDGINVTNIDPGDPEYRWKYQMSLFKKLNKAFGTRVNLIQRTIDKASLKSNNFDRIFCISVLEHLKSEERKVIMKEASRVLKKGGYFIITLDLFLDIFPFSNIIINKWGTNINILELIKDTGFTLVQGNRDELYGYPEFNVNTILSNLDKYLMGNSYPVLSQVFVLRKL